jgi:hypothetical protein
VSRKRSDRQHFLDSYLRIGNDEDFKTMTGVTDAIPTE